MLAYFTPLVLAAWVAVTRVFDHLHDAADVTAGALLGSYCAYYGIWVLNVNEEDCSEKLNNSDSPTTTKKNEVRFRTLKIQPDGLFAMT